MSNSNSLTISSLMPQKIGNLPSVAKTYVGIDFGTSTTVVSIATYNNSSKSLEIQTVPIDQILEDGAETTTDLVPSAIAVSGTKLLVGEGASYLKYILRLGEDVWYSFKMQLGEGIIYYREVLLIHIFEWKRLLWNSVLRSIGLIGDHS